MERVQSFTSRVLSVLHRDECPPLHRARALTRDRFAVRKYRKDLQYRAAFLDCLRLPSVLILGSDTPSPLCCTTVTAGVGAHRQAVSLSIRYPSLQFRVLQQSRNITQASVYLV